MTSVLVAPAIRSAETALVERARGGDHEAFAALVDGRLATTYRTTLAILGNEADARDATQEIFLRAWRNLPELREPDRFGAWFGRIVVNTCRTAIRGRRRRIVREISVGALPGEGEQLASPDGPHDHRPVSITGSPSGHGATSRRASEVAGGVWTDLGQRSSPRCNSAGLCASSPANGYCRWRCPTLEECAMRRRILALVALATLLVPAASVAADTTGGGGTSFHFSETGKGADAGWTTSPADGQPVTDVVYTDTFLSTAEQAAKEDGTVYADKFLFFDQTSYKYDRSGNWIFVSETSGFAGGSDVVLSVNAKLTSASVTATVGFTTCTVDRRGNVTCVDGTGFVSGSWTGQGDTIKSSGTYHIVSKGFTENSKSRQTFRNAIASGSLNGARVGGQPFVGDIFSSTSRDIFICHGPGAC